MNRSRLFPSLALFVAGLLLSGASTSAGGEVPVHFASEDTGLTFPKPPLPEFSALPTIPHLPDPFMKADGTRIATRDEWRSRRAEIKARLEHYGVGK